MSENEDKLHTAVVEGLCGLQRAIEELSAIAIVHPNKIDVTRNQQRLHLYCGAAEALSGLIKTRDDLHTRLAVAREADKLWRK